MLIRFHEQTISDFTIPAFTLSKGEIVVIELFGGAVFRPLILKIVTLLTGIKATDVIELMVDFRFAEHFKESRFKSTFFPCTVKGFHRKYANKANPIYKKIYDIPLINPATKVHELTGARQKLLSIYTTLSWTNNIIFDLAGVDPQGGQDIYRLIKTITEAGGAAILLDLCDEFNNDCTTFITAEYTGEPAKPPVLFVS